MKYWKYIGATGNICVFGASDEQLSAHYCCTKLPNTDRKVWARIHNRSTDFLRLTDKTEISEEEYKNHLRFCVKIISKQIEDQEVDCIAIDNGAQVFDYTYFDL